MKRMLNRLWHAIQGNRYGHLLIATAQGWRDVRVSRLAASLSFYAMLSLVPLMITFHALFSLVMDEQTLAAGVDAQVRQFLGNDQAQALRGMIDQAHSPSFSTIKAIVGFILTVVTAGGVFVELKDSMDVIWKTPVEKTKGIMAWIGAYLKPLSMVLGFGFLLLISLLLQALLSLVANSVVTWQPGLVAVATVGNLVIGWVVTTMLFAAIFRWLPSATIAMRDVWLGAALTATLFSVGHWAISFYIGQSDFSQKYGAAGPIIAIFVWIYYSAQILFTGAVFTREHARAAKRFHDQRPDALPK